MTARVSIAPVIVPASDRGGDIRVRVTASTDPADPADRGVIVFAHGFGESMHSYDPLVDHWTSHGFVVIQPTFLDSREIGLTPTDPRYQDIWRIRVHDVTRVIDHLGGIMGSIPGLAADADPERLAVVGHSWGAQTVGMHLGARVLGDEWGSQYMADDRVRAGVLLAATGTGGSDLTPFAQANFPFMSPDFSELRTPTLVIAGDRDQSPLSTRGPDWFTDAYRLSPGAAGLVTLFGGEHMLGGIQGYGRADTTDESPSRVELVRRTSTAFLQEALGIVPGAWSTLAAAPFEGGRIERKLGAAGSTRPR